MSFVLQLWIISKFGGEFIEKQNLVAVGDLIKNKDGYSIKITVLSECQKTMVMSLRDRRIGGRGNLESLIFIFLSVE